MPVDKLNIDKMAKPDKKKLKKKQQHNVGFSNFQRKNLIFKTEKFIICFFLRIFLQY